MASVEPLKLLISLGFDPDEVNHAKETPLFVAARTNNIDAACILIENNVDYGVKNNQGKLHLELGEALASDQSRFSSRMHGVRLHSGSRRVAGIG